MRAHRNHGPLLLLVTLVAAASLAACGTGSSGNPGTLGVADSSAADTTASDDSAPADSDFVFDSTDAPLDAAHLFDVTPSALQVVTVNVGATTPTVAFQATLDGSPVNAAWSLDRGEIGTIAAGPSAQGLFTPGGKVGGLVTIRAGLNGQTLTRQVFVKLTGTQNGGNPSVPAEAAQIPTTTAQLGAGGGVGGVGGEGLGVALADAPTQAALNSPSGDGTAQGLTWLYPYDRTVFPRGILAPLLQWAWPAGDADAIAIHLETSSGSFSWTGTFARPAILSTTGGKFVRHPIPQDVWDMATNSAGGSTPSGAPDRLTVSLTIAKGALAYGPIRETWTIAPARLAGTVYYNSYGTQLVKNSTDLAFNGTQYGAAVLGIKGGALGPSVVAGTASPVGPGTGCRVCHSVSANGDKIVVQHGENYARTSSYDLKAGAAETSLSAYDGTFGWAGLSPDGKLALTNAADLAANAPATRLYAFPPTSATPLAATGIPANLQGGTPTFSPDGRHVAFDFLGGTIGSTTGNGTQLVSLDFDPSTLTFSNLAVLATMPAGKRAGFPSFFPTNDAVAFHYQTVSSNHRYNTWHGARAQIWWSDLKTGTAMPLHALNGLAAGGASSYLPTNANNHADDTTLNYEPTVNPVASGGYVWVVFTSRRLYGNVATSDPWLSDPRNYDTTNLANTTCKKLWVAAIDLNAKPGTDASHPAFYLPAQELLAGNARGFWVLDPCKGDGLACDSGDQCCNGYCQPPASGGALVCSNTPPTAHCSQPQEKCTTKSDCCDTTNVCVNGFCSLPGPM
jgi:hypothetical protein